MRRPSLLVFALSWLVFASCDDLPTSDPSAEPAPNPSSSRVRLEVSGTSCEGNVRWEVGSRDNGSGDDRDFPWSLNVDAESGDRVFLRACNECQSNNDLTVTTRVIWRGQTVATETRSGEPRRNQCRPTADVAVTLP